MTASRAPRRPTHLALAKGLATPRGPAPLALAVYGTLFVGTLVLADVFSVDVFEITPWLDVPTWAQHPTSVGLGALLAWFTVAATRVFVKRWDWARQLHTDLRPSIRDATGTSLVILGVLSGIAEEVFFRGFLLQEIGLVLSCLAFGALHRLGGRVGLIWATWAAVMGLLFGVLFLATGSLLGPIVAHAAINMANLRFLRDTDLEPSKPRHLGGLLGEV